MKHTATLVLLISATFLAGCAPSESENWNPAWSLGLGSHNSHNGSRFWSELAHQSSHEFAAYNADDFLARTSTRDYMKLTQFLQAQGKNVQSALVFERMDHGQLSTPPRYYNIVLLKTKDHWKFFSSGCGGFHINKKEIEGGSWTINTNIQFNPKEEKLLDTFFQRLMEHPLDEKKMFDTIRETDYWAAAREGRNHYDSWNGISIARGYHRHANDMFQPIALYAHSNILTHPDKSYRKIFKRYSKLSPMREEHFVEGSSSNLSVQPSTSFEDIVFEEETPAQKLQREKEFRELDDHFLAGTYNLLHSILLEQLGPMRKMKTKEAFAFGDHYFWIRQCLNPEDYSWGTPVEKSPDIRK